MIIRANDFIVPILHPESTWNGSKLDKAKPLIQVTSMDITLDNRIELKDTKADPSSLLKAAFHQTLADVKPTA